MEESLFERKFWCSTGDVTDIADFVRREYITRECIKNYLLTYFHTMAPFPRVMTASPLETTFRIIKWDVVSHFLRPAFYEFLIFLCMYKKMYHYSIYQVEYLCLYMYRWVLFTFLNLRKVNGSLKYPLGNPARGAQSLLLKISRCLLHYLPWYYISYFIKEGA